MKMKVADGNGGTLRIEKVIKFNNNNNTTNKQLLEIVINEIRENRQEINFVKAKLITGAGKIGANSQAVKDIHSNLRSVRNRSWIGAGGITIALNLLKELIKKFI